jgi:hypothetical protein
MAKYNAVLREQIQPVRRPSRAPRFIFFVLLVILSPVAYECGLLCYARWKLILGSYFEPRTPVLDYLSEYWRVFNVGLDGYSRLAFNAGPWKPGIAVPGFIFCSVVGTLFLRKGQ